MANHEEGLSEATQVKRLVDTINGILSDGVEADPELVAAFLMLIDNPQGMAALKVAVKKRDCVVIHKDTLTALVQRRRSQPTPSDVIGSPRSDNPYRTVSDTPSQAPAPFPKAPYLPR